MMIKRTDEELEWIANNEAWDYDIRIKATEEIMRRELECKQKTKELYTV